MGWQTVVCEVTFPVAQVVKHDPLTAKAARMLDVSPEMVGRATKIQATSPKIASEVLKGNLALDQAEQRLNVDGAVEPLDVAETICITVRKLQDQGATDQEIAAALDENAARLLDGSGGPIVSTDLDTSATESNGKMVPPIDQAQRAAIAQILRLRTTDGKDGGKRLFAACCRTIQWDLSDEEAIGAIRSYHAERPFPTVWTDTQVVSIASVLPKRKPTAGKSSKRKKPVRPRPFREVTWMGTASRALWTRWAGLTSPTANWFGEVNHQDFVFVELWQADGQPMVANLVGYGLAGCRRHAVHGRVRPHPDFDISQGNHITDHAPALRLVYRLCSERR